MDSGGGAYTMDVKSHSPVLLWRMAHAPPASVSDKVMQT